MPLVHRTAEVLVVEDSPVDIRLISEALEEAGPLVRIHIVEDGDAAVAFLTDGEVRRGGTEAGPHLARSQPAASPQVRGLG